jgi:hypothetical protein
MEKPGCNAAFPRFAGVTLELDILAGPSSFLADLDPPRAPSNDSIAPG